MLMKLLDRSFFLILLPLLASSLACSATGSDATTQTGGGSETTGFETTGTETYGEESTSGGGTGSPTGGGEETGQETGCTPDCTGKDCGDDGCGASCGTCADGQVCGETFSCVDIDAEGGGIPQFETNCNDGNDEDEDGLTDCADSDCTGVTGCIETDCADTIDNEGDGLPDCHDPDCDCEVVGCADYFMCLTEEGCSCTLDEDCPEPGTDAYATCQQNCAESPQCTQTCGNLLNPTQTADLAAFQFCAQALCATQEEGEAYTQCLAGKCLEEYAFCFYTGLEDCADFYFSCATNCPDDDGGSCIDGCIDQLSPDGFIDAKNWDQCRFDLCNTDGDNTIDSTSCYYLGSFFACVENAGTCIPEHLMTDAGECDDVVQCTLECETFSESSCVLDCIEQIGPSNSLAVSNFYTCAISACGSTDEALTPACISQAISSECQPEWLICASPTP
jgi:hypothetical protein